MLLSATADSDLQNKLGKGKGEYAFSTKDDDSLKSVSSAPPEWFQISDIRLIWGKVWYLCSGDDVEVFLLHTNNFGYYFRNATYLEFWI